MHSAKSLALPSARLQAEIEAWQQQGNDAGARICWMLSPEKARAKMRRAYRAGFPVGFSTSMDTPRSPW